MIYVYINIENTGCLQTEMVLKWPTGLFDSFEMAKQVQKQAKVLKGPCKMACNINNICIMVVFKNNVEKYTLKCNIR